MLKPQEKKPNPPVPVFGKPWYWQRSSGTMESATRSLEQVIVEMSQEIHELQAENRELRRGEVQGQQGPSGQQGEGESPESSLQVEDEQQQEGIGVEVEVEVEENPYGSLLRRNASAPFLEGQHKENSVMTVRRYSVGANLAGVTMREGRSDCGWGRLQGNTLLTDSARAVGRAPNRRSLQEYVHKNRSKVKTVTFLLPVEDIYTNQPVLSKHSDEEPKSTELASITETDS